MLIPFLYSELFFFMLCFSVYDRGVGCMPNYQFMKKGLYGFGLL